MLNAKSSPSVVNFSGAPGTLVSADGHDSNGDTGDNEKLGAPNWVAIPSDPQPRDQACTAIIGNALFVAGGVDNGNEQDSTETYKVLTNAWSPKATIPNWVTYGAGATVKGLFYCFGGGSSNTYEGSYYSYTQVYHP
jgi:N-acetylneuraminic acid mutarotase